MSQKDILAELKAKIGKNLAPTPPTTPRESSAAPKAASQKKQGARETPAPKEAPRSGRGVQFYLEDADRKIINSLAVWFASQDRRVSDSQVVKAAIRMAEAHQGSKLLDVCDQVRSTDRRRQKKAGK